MSKVIKQANTQNNLQDNRVGVRSDNLHNITGELWSHENLKYESKNFYNNEGSCPKTLLNIKNLRDNYLNELLKGK